MPEIFSHQLHSAFRRFSYRYRFLASYVVIGFASIVAELILVRAATPTLGELPARLLGLAVGILAAFYLNVRFNFKVPAPKRNRALQLFILISLFSFGVSLLLRHQLMQRGFRYEEGRLLASGALFLIGYALHRRFSFREYKQVGVAVYAHGGEDIRGIHAKVGSVADFIHIDIVDATFNVRAPDPTTYRLEAVRAFWPDKPIHCHLMTRTPSVWLDQVLPFVDVVVIHLEIDEDVAALLARIREAGRSPGLCLGLETPLEAAKPFLAGADELMLLSIPVPGASGQPFSMAALDRIRAVNQMEERRHLVLCVDGGIDNRTIRLVQAEKVVSGSYVLNGDDPMRNIMRLQTSSQYEAV